MRFVVDPEPVVLGLDEEPHVEVQVGKARGPGPESHARRCRRWRRRAPALPVWIPRALSRSATARVSGVSVAVTTGLQPSAERAMVRKEHAVARHVQDPRRARDAADPAGTVETVGVRVDEGIEARDGRRLLRPSLAVFGEESLQSVTVHGTRRRGAVLALMRIIDPHPIGA